MIRGVAIFACGVLLASLAQPGAGQTASVLTQHNDLSRDGANPHETTLTTSNVNESTFGKVFSFPVDGLVFAQPLYVPAATIPGEGTHNIVYVATEHNSVYAFDADSGELYWQVSLGTSVPSAVIPAYVILNEVGITSTPVIDPVSGTIYVVPKTYENGQQIYRLHALDITTGKEKTGSPVEITATIAGLSPDSSSGGVLPFVPARQLQRAAVTLVNGVVYLAFTSHEDISPSHGWVLGYDASSLQQVQKFITTPNSDMGTIWMGGQGLVADSSNNLYLLTANSNEAWENLPGDYGESFLKLVPNGNSLTVGDYFKPFNYDYLNSVDGDVGSGGAFAIPGTNYIAGGGKQGLIYVVDTTKMGGLNMSADQVVQEFQATNYGLWGSPAFFNNTMYIWGRNYPLLAYPFNGTIFGTHQTSQSSVWASSSGETSGSVSVSSNGTEAGTAIVWATSPVSDPGHYTVGGTLYAFDATNLGNMLWSSAQNPSRDSYGNYAKFVAPTIANGKVYVATDSDQIAVYGLLSSATVTLGNLSQTYTGSPLAATATTIPSGLTVKVFYTGVGGTIWGPTGTPPTAAGTYEVAASISDATYTGTATGTLVIDKAAATVTLTNLWHSYDGTEKAASATTTPAGLNVIFTYNGSTTAPSAVGTYTVVGTIGDPNYHGSANGTMTIAKGSATVTLGGLTQTYTGSPLSATATTIPAGLDVHLTYDGSTTAPTAAGSYLVGGTIVDPTYQGTAKATMNISKATATVTLENLAQTYTGSPLSATAATAPAGLKVTFTYNGSSTAPTAAGSYTVVGTIDDPNYQGTTATGTLVISKATATVALGNLSQTYTGSLLAATATTKPSGLQVKVFYTGIGGINWGPTGAPPTAAGSYTVVGNVSDPNYQGTSTGTLVIGKAAATVTLTNLWHGYDGTEKSASATTTPARLKVIFTYNGSATAPSAVGNYTVVGTIGDPNYHGSATGTMTIAKGSATVTLGGLTQTYTGSPLSATATTIPAGLEVHLTYNGSTTAPTAVGSYLVGGTIIDPNYQGTSEATMTISKATATVTLGNLTQRYTGSPLPATATTAPTGLKVNLKYTGTGSTTFGPTSVPPTGAGNYAIAATVNDANYNGTAIGTLVVTKATPSISWSTPAAITYGTALSATQLNATSLTQGTFIYGPAAGSILAGGSQQLSVTLNPTDTTDYTTATAAVALKVNQQSQTISFSPSTLTYASGVTFGSPSLSMSATATSGLPVTLSLVAGPAVLNGNSLTATGAGKVVIAANQAGNGNYLAAPQTTENITVNKALPVSAITSNANPILLQNSVTLTATSSSDAGTPTGTVTFLDGTAPLGTGTLTGGVATFTTTSLTTGTHSLSVAYSGDANFLATSSSPLTQLVQDFAFTISAPSATVTPGSAAVFSFTVGPMQGTTFPSSIILALSGLPAGATYSFSPATIAAGAGATAVTLTVDIPQAQAGAKPVMLHPGTQLAVNYRGGSDGRKTGRLAARLMPFSLAFVMLPFFGGLRRNGKRLRRIVCALLLLTAGMTAAFGISGCGGSASGNFAQAQQNYAVTVTGTSGALSHSTTVTLIVE
jgi:hypothetical protein